MAITSEEQSKTAPGQLELVQAFINTEYGSKKYAHMELADAEQLRNWLIAHGLLTDDEQVTEGDFRHMLRLREALREQLRVNSGMEDAVDNEMLNTLARNAPLIVHFQDSSAPTLERDIAGVDGAIAHLIGIVFTAIIDGSWDRLKVCRKESCRKAFYDTSKNRSGAWCSMIGCGSRAKSRAYRARRVQDNLKVV